MSPVKQSDGSAKKWIVGIVISIVPLLLGAGIAWGVASNTVSSSKEDLTRAKIDIGGLQTEQAGIKVLVEDTRQDIRDLKDDIKEDLKEIKDLVRNHK